MSGSPRRRLGSDTIHLSHSDVRLLVEASSSARSYTSTPSSRFAPRLPFRRSVSTLQHGCFPQRYRALRSTHSLTSDSCRAPSVENARDLERSTVSLLSAAPLGTGSLRLLDPRTFPHSNLPSRRTTTSSVIDSSDVSWLRPVYNYLAVLLSLVLATLPPSRVNRKPPSLLSFRMLVIRYRSLPSVATLYFGTPPHGRTFRSMCELSAAPLLLQYASPPLPGGPSYGTATRLSVLAVLVPLGFLRLSLR